MPFGQVRYLPGTPAITSTDFGYTGQRDLDSDMGLMDYKARFYSPLLGRFVQPDTVTPAGPQGLNRYSYVNNNPVTLSDPTGHCGEVTYHGSSTTSNLCNNTSGYWSYTVGYNFSALVNLVLNSNSFGITGNDVAEAFDAASTGLDTAAFVIDAAIAVGDIAAATVGATIGAGVSIPEGGAPAVVTGPAGALLGLGLFELNPVVRGAMVVGNGLATISTMLTSISDVITGETNDIQSLTLSSDGIEYHHDTFIGRDTATSTGLTIAGWISPIGLTSAPLQGAALLNDVGLLYTWPMTGALSLTPKSLNVRHRSFQLDWEKE